MRGQKFHLFSLYCRPSIRDIQSFLLSLSSTISPLIAKRAILCIDSNALNPLWNSRTLDDRGRAFEEFFRALGLNIVNVELSLEHIPTNISFLDITSAGDLLHLSEWKFLDIPSLSDHRFILFSLQIRNEDSPPNNYRAPKRFPRLSACQTDTFISSLEQRLENFPAIDHSYPVSTKVIDDYISDLTGTLLTCATNSKLPPHPAFAKGKMPWWNEELWSLRYHMQRSYQAKCDFPSVENIETYTNMKSKYQKRLLERKVESWKAFCTNNSNGDPFGALKRITETTVSHSPPPLIKIDGAISCDSLLTLKAFSSSFFPKSLSSSQFHHRLESEVLDKMTEPNASFEPISRAEILTAIDCLKANQSPGTDGCPAEWLKCSSSSISHHVAALFNACLAVSYFPDDWRIARVIILRKQNKPHYDDPSCYRPISILCAFAKVFERIIYTRLKVLADSSNGS